MKHAWSIPRQASFRITGAAQRPILRTVAVPTDETPSIEIHPGAVELIRDQGGCLYIWIDGAGMKHVRHQPPSRTEKDWFEFEVEGVRLFVDEAIDPPQKWVVVIHHLPWRHVDALYNGDIPGAGSVGMTAWH
ncbi:MAG: hypothetical protein QOJ71_2876 [Actinomycetota bacterium]|nr:hypothetical protein [Actinomycetota bacterium]